MGAQKSTLLLRVLCGTPGKAMHALF